MAEIKRLIISCGGTAGHFNPGLAIACEFKKQGGEVMLLLGGKESDKIKQAAAAEAVGIKAVLINAERPVKSPLKLIGFALRLVGSVSACAKICRDFKADAVLSMGCYASFPAALGARKAGVKLFIHDGNAKIGKANIFMSRFASGAALSFPAVNAGKLKCPSFVTGLPLRAGLVAGRFTKEEAIEIFRKQYGISVDPSKRVVLIFGGSLGAGSINDNIAVDTGNPAVVNLHIIHLAGPGKAESVKSRYASLPCTCDVLEACQDMHLLYTICDCVIARAGGSTVSELAFFGKYALLIPLPIAAERHQDDNARFLCSASGAEMVDDTTCSNELFSSFISRFLADSESYIAKGRLSCSLAAPDAASDIIKMIESSL